MKNKVVLYLLSAMANDFWQMANSASAESYRAALRYVKVAAHIEKHTPGMEDELGRFPEPDWEGEYCGGLWIRRLLYEQSFSKEQWYRRLLLAYIGGNKPSPLSEDEACDRRKFDAEYRKIRMRGKNLEPPELEFQEE